MQNLVSRYFPRRMGRSLLPGNLLLTGAECERADRRAVRRSSTHLLFRRFLFLSSLSLFFYVLAKST